MMSCIFIVIKICNKNNTKRQYSHLSPLLFLLLLLLLLVVVVVLLLPPKHMQNTLYLTQVLLSVTVCLEQRVKIHRNLQKMFGPSKIIVKL